MLEMVRTAALLVATITTGLVTGVFVLYAHTIMPGLRRTDDRAFVAAFQAIDRAIINPWFLVAYVGTPLYLSLAALLQLGGQRSAVLTWIIAAFVLYTATMVITGRVHLPLNNRIKAAGDPDSIPDLAAVRAEFDEARWVRWNRVRVVTSLAAFACVAWALVEHGRLT